MDGPLDLSPSSPSSRKASARTTSLSPATRGAPQTLSSTIDRHLHASYFPDIDNSLGSLGYPQLQSKASTRARTLSPPRGDAIFSNTYGFQNAYNLPTMDSPLSGAAYPPFTATEVIHSLQASDGHIIKPHISARIDKGFSIVDDDWICYRRNYFSLNCSYTLMPIWNGPIYVGHQGDARGQVRGFAMSIAAVVDGRDGKPVELVQNTPKRDKGSQEPPPKIPLSPHFFALAKRGGGSGRGIPTDPSGDFGLEPGKPAQEAYFKRIQFKTATANIGKRRATQQYYRLLVELFADLGPQSADPWVKVAFRMSPPLVVRSRNPGHYASQGARDSYTPYGSMMSGGEGTGAYGSKAARSTDDMTMSDSSSMLSGFDRSPSYDTSSYPSRAQDPILPMIKNLSSLSDMTITGSLSMPPSYSRSLPHNTSSRPSRAQVSNVLISKNLPSPGAANNKRISESKTVMSERLESSREQKQGRTEVAKTEVAISKPLKVGQAAPLLSKHWPRDNLKSSHLPPPVRHVSEQAPAREVPELSERKRGFHEVKSNVVSRSEAQTKNSSTCHVPAGHKEVQKKKEDIEFLDSTLPSLSLSPFVGEGSSKMDVESVVDLDSVLESTTVTQSCKRQTTSLTKTLKNMLKTFFGPSHQVGYRRVEWTCGCGETLYADFQNGSSDAVKRLAAILQSPNPSSDTREAPAALIPIYEMGTQISRQPSASSSTSLSRRSSTSTQSRPTSSVSSAGSSTRSHATNELYLEVCINTGEYTKTLSEIDLRDVRSDWELFHRIRKEYLRQRGFRCWFWLHKPSGVHFVRFSVEDPPSVGILQKPFAVPPPDEVKTKRTYSYYPCPLQDDPPMPQHVFLHLLSCAAYSPKSAWLPRLPKKLDSSILRFTGSMNYGWGIHINEGPDYFVIGIINFVMMVLSGLAAFLWNWYKSDFQGGFGFAGWIVAVVNAILVAYVVKWQRE